MIVKNLKIPLAIHGLEALVGRIPEPHPAIPLLKKELSKRQAGYYGERSLLYYLEQLPQKNVCIFHNLRLELNGIAFEMDLLLVTTKYVLIIETKNIAGEIHFDHQFGQLIRTLNDKKEAFPDPLEQVRRQSELLHAWIGEKYGLQIPIETLVVVSNSSTIITANQNKAYLFKNVIHANKLLSRIRDLDGKYRVELVELQKLKRICNKLLHEHKELKLNLLEKFKIQKNELLTGVRCTNCKKLGMERMKRSWHCPRCGCIDRDAHKAALRDYFLLVSPTITNQECREFLQLSSPDVANRLLKGLNLSKSGVNKGTTYEAPKNLEDLLIKK